MDIRQVALGAAFGAAVAVNAALQSLQDAGSFLIHSPGPSSRSRPVDLLDATTRDARKRPLSFVDDVDDDEDDFDAFKNNDEDEARNCPALPPLTDHLFEHEGFLVSLSC
ncbi:hypothetical protein MPTK1_4g13300 [Marchantia polymorpha subsp. ruderalis]|uniref:Uncharacterized protein n=1 Tax=Marchantia polymorpha subsp. ruderalis TaxID=1480154 RepID=A0AAF6B9G8_MARPO|nr:hypothetical protein Mp_4g13300 [Marchantia polymorpha subsp. ruderalis]